MKQAKLAIIFGLVVLALIQSAAATAPVCTLLGTFAPGATVTITDPGYNPAYIYTWDNGFPGITAGTPGTWTFTAPTAANPNQYPLTLTGNLVVSQDLEGCTLSKCFTIKVVPTSDCDLTPGQTVCETDDMDMAFTYTPKVGDSPSTGTTVLWTITKTGETPTSLPPSVSGATLSGTGYTKLTMKWETFIATHGGAGEYTITATFNGCSKSSTVTVVPIPVIGTITAA
jgi:hypothetical protein